MDSSPVCDVFERAIDHWRATGAQVRPPASESEIEETFAALDFPLTDDVRRLYSLADGFEDWDQNSCFWWWSLERIREENQVPERDPNYLWFADFLIWTYAYCFRVSDEKSSAVWIDNGSWGRFHQPGLVSRIADGFRSLVGRERILLNEAEYERYAKTAESVPDFLEKYLHNPEDVDVY